MNMLIVDHGAHSPLVYIVAYASNAIYSATEEPHLPSGTAEALTAAVEKQCEPLEIIDDRPGRLDFCPPPILRSQIGRSPTRNPEYG